MKALLVNSEGLIQSHGYSLVQLSVDGKSRRIGKICDSVYGFLSCFKLTRRLFRAEITGLYQLSDGGMIAVAKKGIFLKESLKGSKGSRDFHKVFEMPRGSKPLNLCILPNGHIYFGEYFQNMDKAAVNIYGSLDNGASWHVAYTFPTDSINHIHGLFFDKFTQRIWFLTGDRENECIIGYTEDEFSSIVEVFRGGQEFRSCNLFFYEGFIVFATDSQYLQNEIKCFDRDTLEIHSLVKIQGSAIKGGQSGDVSFISTTVEPSDVNTDKSVHVWVSRNGRDWKDVFSADKDCWPSIFQFATVEFPRYECLVDDNLYVTGRAVKQYDGKSIRINIK